MPDGEVSTSTQQAREPALLRAADVNHALLVRSASGLPSVALASSKTTSGRDQDGSLRRRARSRSEWPDNRRHSAAATVPEPQPRLGMAMQITADVCEIAHRMAADRIRWRRRRCCPEWDQRSALVRWVASRTHSRVSRARWLTVISRRGCRGQTRWGRGRESRRRESGCAQAR